ncbi:AlpA family phage regulatory protein [Bradyrhizobium sp. 157]|uniref:helix-turn-helix transcriptional regulator n=1 Tax=Bradyrhizobium sp. 157 TaxID=2782631 RepID=UPI001FF99FA0|nr:AlpA family phage regulatory protein [Bradyrhizobium sp. 157]MCK1640340.1 AlpA family phage regulatory protein [Bradyrhizobium sp. 157]
MEDGTPDRPGPRRMLSEAQVLAIVPISRTTLFRLAKSGRFPKGTYISPNRRVWYEDEIVDWQRLVDEFNPRRGRGRRQR